MSDLPQRSGRASTLELFFDLVFVFTITQLTGDLVDGEKKAIGDPYDPLHGWIALGLGAGAALFILSDVGFRRTFGLARNRIRLVAAAAALTTIPLGTELGAAAQVAAIAAVVVAALAAEASLRAQPYRS